MSTCATCRWWSVLPERRQTASLAPCTHVGTYDARTEFSFSCKLYAPVEAPPAAPANPGPGQPTALLHLSRCANCGRDCHSAVVAFGRRRYQCPSCGNTWSMAV